LGPVGMTAACVAAITVADKTKAVARLIKQAPR